MEFQSRIEDELRCRHCSQLYVDAVLLSCSHSVCLQCALQLANECSSVFGSKCSSSQPRPDSLTVPAASPAAAEDANLTGGCSRADSDRSSVGSETDSGVICTVIARSTTPSASANSRPNSFLAADTATPIVATLSTTSSQDSGSSSSSAHAQIICPRCRRTTGLDDCSLSAITGCLPRSRCLETVVDRYRNLREIPIFCQRCQKNNGELNEELGAAESAVSGKRAAAGMCEQCLMFLCDECVEAGRHGPGCVNKQSGQMIMSPTSTGKSWLSTMTGRRAVSCVEHADETASLYCTDCRTEVCCHCADVTSTGHHSTHQTKPLADVYRSQKVSRSSQS